MRRRRCGLVLCALAAGFPLAALAAESARPLAPVIQSIFPRGGRQGAEVEVTVKGKYLGGASGIRISGGGVAAKILRSSESQILAKITIAPDALVGRRDLRVITPQGSFVQVFEVGALPEMIEVEPNDDWSKAPAVSMPIIINGRIDAGDYDHFRFQAQAGQTLTFDLSSSRVGTRFDGVLSLLDSTGREIAAQDDYYFDKDPHLVYRFSEDGEYILRVSGFREAGSPNAEYRLMMGELPSLSWVFPAGGRRGGTVEVALAGANLGQVEGIALGSTASPAEILHRAAGQLKVRLHFPANLEPGIYPLRVRQAGMDLPNPLLFAVSDTRELVLTESPSPPLVLETPVIINGCMCSPKQRDNFWIDVQAGEQLTFQADGMKLGNFLDPSVTIYDQPGQVVAYMDEIAPNGFDKEPPNLDVHLVHRFERGGRYRVEMRDAGLRGRAELIYRLLVDRAEPAFELTTLTNQVTLMPGHPAAIPVHVRRVSGWNTPVKVWVENLPARVEYRTAIAEPVNTRFRGTFGEDFFFDGTNVDLLLQAHEGASLGNYPVRVKAQGVMNGKTLERTATVFYPWQQTGYLRGPTDEQQLLITVANRPLFDLEGPASISLTRGQVTEFNLTVLWFTDPRESISLAPAQLPPGVILEKVEVKPGADKIAVWARAAEDLEKVSGPISVEASIRVGERVYKKLAPDIEIKLQAPKAEERLTSRQ